jgi:NAD(P)-dependent dehydrogenase (short-subunit alcohol dehydrogenase family)
VTQIAGKVAVITGAASGIGFGLARRLVDGGAAVVLADIEQSSLDEATRALSSDGADVLSVRTDVTVQNEVDVLAAAALEKFGAIHLVFANAGVSAGAGARTWEQKNDDWDWIFAVNVFGVVNTIRTFVPILLTQREGHVVVTASNSSILSLLGVPAYAASKHAVISLSESLQQDLTDIGSPVRVSVVLPGPVKTQLADAERNRQPRFGEGNNRPQEVIAAATEKLASYGDEPVDHADLVISGLEEDRFYILSRPNDIEKARNRFDGIVAGRLAPPSSAV